MPESPRERVAANVRAEVGRRQLTQASVAVILGKSQQSVSKKMRGSIPFDLEELDALASALSVPVEQFLATTAGAA